MSSTDSRSYYTFSVEIDNGYSTNQTGMQIDSNSGMTDAMAFALVDAISGLGWPGGASVAVTVSKQDVTDVAYTTNPTATPPSFT